VVTKGEDILSRHAPIFVLQNREPSYNRIGAAAARVSAAGEEEVYVDPASPTYYGARAQFETDRGPYTNLIYRVHFERVPFPHLGMGRNVGLLAVITLDPADRPVLITTVNTCGCYLAFVPTSLLPGDALPPGWDRMGQDVWGEELPGLLRCPEPFDPAYRPVIFLRNGTHRVADLKLQNVEEAGWRYKAVEARIEPREALDELPLDSGTTSFFFEQGAERGLVKGSEKPLEFLLMSWWALDWNVGRDRRLAPSAETGKTFYTSLKFWNRGESDMHEFAEFLRFWGWRL
jgi:hypothetical protein